MKHSAAGAPVQRNTEFPAERRCGHARRPPVAHRLDR